MSIYLCIVKESPSYVPPLPPIPTKCPSKQQIVFVKTHKTGSTTLARLIEQYAVDHKLNVVRKIGERGSVHFDQKFNYGCPKLFLPPRGVKTGDYKNYKYDIFTIHAHYNRSVYDSFMNENSFYFTILRNPVMQFESAFDFFSIGSKVKLTGSKENILDKFMLNVEKYWKKLGKMQKRYMHNNQLWDMGVDDVSICLKQNCSNNLFEKLDNEMDLVLINEFYDESLILLKKMLCWDFEDILYLPRNKRAKRTNMTTAVYQKIAKWNAADMKLYNYFEERLKERISNYGEDFTADLAAFREMTKFLLDVCVSKERFDVGTRARNRYLLKQNITSENCQRIGKNDVCQFSNGYTLNLSLPQMCKQVTLDGSVMDRTIRKIMKMQ
ncbi:galactosylceramide sulfotransferase-like [Antedon mediterranea]|uniref:galactosylceramide sulfotransferase-like n=1 Tax=Antedon mediterranea TaxID=105859 RepID=UPI003AF7CABF